MNLDRVFKLLESAASRSDHKFRMAAAIVQRNGIFIGYNRRGGKTHPDSPHSYGQIHAEFAAYRKASKAGVDTQGATIYILRLTKKGIGLAKPCEVCKTFLKKIGIRTAYYTTKTDFESECMKSNKTKVYTSYPA